MSKESWLPLTDYSNKYKVSISTLRRRIKANQVQYIYEDGKYLLKDSPLSFHEVAPTPTTQIAVPSAHSQAPRPLTTQQNWNRVTTAPPQTVQGHPADPVPETKAKASSSDGFGEGALTALGRLEGSVQAVLGEIKKAYALILQEKEEQIIMLKEEVTDLRTLVRVLESENERLKTNARESAPIDAWLNEIDALEK